MNLLHRLGGELAIQRKRMAIHSALKRLDSRGLADLGLAPSDIAPVARLGSRIGPQGARLGDIVARVHASRLEQATLSDRVFSSLEPLSIREVASTAATSPTRELDRYLVEAHRRRDAAIVELGHSIRRALAGFVRPAVDLALTSSVARRIRLSVVWHRTYRKVCAELGSYSERELMADLRLSRSEIGDVAARSADEQAFAYLAEQRAFGRRASQQARLSRAHG